MLLPEPPFKDIPKIKPRTAHLPRRVKKISDKIKVIDSFEEPDIPDIEVVKLPEYNIAEPVPILRKSTSRTSNTSGLAFVLDDSSSESDHKKEPPEIVIKKPEKSI